MRVLQVAAEIYPQVKTGGLADVVGALPPALATLGVDVRLLLPGLPAIRAALTPTRAPIELGSCFGAARVRVLRGHLSDPALPVYVVDAPILYNRVGNPYHAPDGSEWPDNPQRYGLLGWVAAQLGAGALDEHWSADVIHGHDWHAGMACAYLHAHPGSGVRTVFSVHNLAFQGLFAWQDGALLGLPQHLLSHDGIEFHGRLSFLKAGLVHADAVTTVSPRYAREIETTEFGCGMDGVLRSRRRPVQGILNGIDSAVWNPSTDPVIAARYTAARLAGKRSCKAALQAEFGLPVDAAVPLFVAVSRLTAQKGLDLLLDALPMLIERGAQLVVLGAGDAALEQAWRERARMHPDRVGVHLGYDEALAHRLVAGGDFIVVPSRFEPCGLTQLYGLRYGTLPIVRRVGGLADSVVDCEPVALAADAATGFVFDAASPAALAEALARALAVLREPPLLRRVQRRAMAEDHSWDRPAAEYLALYRELVAGG